MANEFEFSFSRKDMETLMVDGVDEIVVSSKVKYDDKTKSSSFEISATGQGTASTGPVRGCPKPC